MRAQPLIALGIWCVGVAIAACAGSGASHPATPGLDDLTPRERRDLELLTRKLPAPCFETPMTVEQCMHGNTDCRGCIAAGRMLFKGVRDGRSREQIEAAFRSRYEQADPKPIDLSDAPVLGNPAAAVTVVEFADFQCPACSSVVPLIDGLLRDFGQYVKVAFKHYPLPFHPNAELAARAAVAAQRQGRFWEMHHKMFQNQRALTAPDLEQYASELGLNLDRFRADLASPETKAKVQRDRAEGTRIGVEGTPAIFIDGRPFSTQLFDTASDLSDWIQAEIELKTGKVVEPAGSAGRPWESASGPIVDRPAGSAGLFPAAPSSAGSFPNQQSSASATPLTPPAPGKGP